MFQNLRVSVRLALGFGLVIALAVATCVLGISSLAAQSRSVDELANNHTPALVYAGEWHARVEAAAKDMRNLFIVPEEDMLEEVAAIRLARKERDRLQGELTKLAQTPKARGALQGIAESGKAYLALEDEFLTLADGGKMQEARDMMLNRIRRVQFAYLEAIDKLVQVLAAEAKSLAAESAGTARASLSLMAAATGASALLALLFAIVVTRSITRPIGEAVAAARRVAHGDLTVDLPTTRRDEAGLLLAALQDMTEQLRHLLGEVAGGAHVVAHTSAQIAQGNQDLSQRTEEQASTLEETASSMEELTSTVAQNADSARQASQLAVGASQVARKGGEVVGQVVSTMEGITASSRKISEIIGVIDGIAFQTNILALNAAVEAARAGEQGRGFAVVAAEVRSLAQRSAAAAKEIKALIGESVEKVGAGARLVDHAGHTMDEIVSAVTKVSDLVADIAVASQEQSSGIQQVNAGVTQMEHVVQQNAGLVEEATAATEAMKAQSASLRQLVARFKLHAGAPAPGAQVAGASEVPAPVPEPLRLLRRPAPRAAANAPEMLAVANGAPRPAGEWQEF
ncbi:methyl-accepting chemotaxis protein [Ramlibacter sp. AN1133]|uniref:methyl-accepting chemotaxis protein n=1 Tax=Ramlibacter sp. AN1133 TaxID=3133429 RepID=UPI0030BC37C2